MNGDKPSLQSSMNNEKPGGINQKRDIGTINMGDAATREGGATTPLQMAPTLGQIIGGFKNLVSKTINEMDGTPGDRLRSAGLRLLPSS
jgi:hypothetical protein